MNNRLKVWLGVIGFCGSFWGAVIFAAMHHG